LCITIVKEEIGICLKGKVGQFVSLHRTSGENSICVNAPTSKSPQSYTPGRRATHLASLLSPRPKEHKTSTVYLLHTFESPTFIDRGLQRRALLLRVLPALRHCRPNSPAHAHLLAPHNHHSFPIHSFLLHNIRLSQRHLFCFFCVLRRGYFFHRKEFWLKLTSPACSTGLSAD
jgi:hypothetical protein